MDLRSLERLLRHSRLTAMIAWTSWSGRAAATAVVGLLLVGLTACGGANDAQPAASNPSLAALDGRSFTASSITRHGSPVEPVAGTTVSLAFTSGQVTLFAGCNRMSGSGRLEVGRLVVGNLAATEMACRSPLMEQERWWADVVTSRPRLGLSGSTVTLARGNDVVVLQEQPPAPDAPLTGTTWQVTGLVTGSGADAAVSSVPSGVEATLRLSDDGSVSGSTGCNALSGQFDATAETVTFGPVATTRRACRPPVDRVERTFLAVVTGTADQAIDGDQLTLTHGAVGLVLTASPD